MGVPEDMLSVSTGYDFPVTDPGRRAALEEFLRQIKPQEEERDYLLDQFSQSLSGRIRKQLVHILSGPVAGNGKSTLCRLLGMAFGGYFCNMPIAYVTQKSGQANAANLIILKLKAARIAVGQEPEEHTRFNGSLLKALSGGDEQEGRSLYSNKLVNYYPQFKMYFACNAMPDIDGSDQGLARRIRRVEFGSHMYISELGLHDVYPPMPLLIGGTRWTGTALERCPADSTCTPPASFGWRKLAPRSPATIAIPLLYHNGTAHGGVWVPAHKLPEGRSRPSRIIIGVSVASCHSDADRDQDGGCNSNPDDPPGCMQ
jgi:hypothetical protein